MGDRPPTARGRTIPSFFIRSRSRSVDEARPVAREALARYRHPELIELCKRHGIEVPPLE